MPYHAQTGKGRRWDRAVRGIATITTAGALCLVAVGLAACGTPSDPGDGDATTTTVTSPSGGIVHPSGSSELVLRVSTGGGFVPVEYNLTMTPEFSLYGDGRVIVTGPVIAIYPGPALPNLQTATISEDAVQAILAAAKEAGLFQSGVDYGQPGITDVGTTSFTLNADGRTYQTDIYALGMESGAGELTMEQQQARAAIQDFRGKLTDLTSLVTTQIEWATYEYKSLAIFSRPVDPNAGTDSTDVAPGYLDWPLGDLATLGEAVDPGYRRVVVTGEDLATLKQKPPLEQANQITIWKSAGREYHLYFRPLLPDEQP
jgi:hypothetical protein